MKHPLFRIVLLACTAWIFGALQPVPSIAYPLPPSRPAILPIEGLSQNSVYAIYRDSHGYYWIGTADGLNLYDGYHIKVYRSHASDSTSLTHSSIRAIAEDHAGNVWVGCDLGVNRFDRKTGKFTRHLDLVHDSVSVWSITFGEDDDSTFWAVGSWGIFRYDPTREAMVPLPGFKLPPGIAIADARFDHHGGIWLATNGGIVFVNTRAVAGSTTYLYNTGGKMIKTICLLRDGSLIAGIEDEGVYYYEKNGGAVSVLNSDARISILEEDSLGRIWIGTREKGIVVTDHKGNVLDRFLSGTLDSPGLPSPIVRSIVFDPTGIVFVGTDGGGAAKIDPFANRFQLLRHDPKDVNSISGNFIKALFEDRDGNFWVGTAGDGLCRFDKATKTWKTFRHDPSRSSSLSSSGIKAVGQDGNGTMWVSTDASFEYFDPARDISTPIHYAHLDIFPKGNVYINSFYADSSGTMWLCTNAGLEEYNPHTRSFRHHYTRDLGWPVALCATAVYSKDGGFRIAIGTQSSGVVIVDPRTDTYVQYVNTPGSRNSLSNNTVKSLCWSKQGILWVGTEDGLNSIDLASGAIRSFGEAEGLSNGYIYGVLEDGAGRVWCSTNNGLVQYFPESGRFRNFDLEDGLQGMEFNTGAYCRDREGHLCFGGINGVNIFDPGTLADNPHPPIVRIVGLRTDQHMLADEEALMTARVISIEYGERTLEVDYVGIEYSDPLQIRYLYRLDGVEREWVNAGEARTARYTTLEPGEYTFHVVAANGDGLRSPEGASIRIIVVPPFWRTAWFLTIAVIVLLAGVVLIVRLITLRAVRRRLEEAERRNALERERTRIAKDMHDEVGASLTRIALLSDSVHRQTGVPDGASKQMEKISATARDVIENMSEIIWAMNPGNDTLDNLTAYMRQHVVESCEAAGLEYDVAIDDILPGIKVSSEFRRNVFLCVKEALHNSVKHAGATTIWFAVQYGQTNILEIVLRDDGKGFAAEGRSQFGNGLKNMPKRIEEIQGSFEIQSIPGEGTTVSVTIPITTFM